MRCGSRPNFLLISANFRQLSRVHRGPDFIGFCMRKFAKQFWACTIGFGEEMKKDLGGSKSQRRRQKLIAALLNQPNLEKTAADVGISLSTAFRIRQTPEFQAEYLQARRDLVSQAGARLQQSCGAASSVLRSWWIATVSRASGCEPPRQCSNTPGSFLCPRIRKSGYKASNVNWPNF